jgi:hypothetical protein
MSEVWPDVDETEREFLTAHGEALRRAQVRHEDCPSFQLIIAAKGEALPEEARAQVNEHLIHCASCRLLAEDIEAAELPELTIQEKARMQARLAPVLGEHARSSSWNWLRSWVLRPIPIAALAAIVLAVSGVIIMRNSQPGKPPLAVVQPPAPSSTLVAALQLDKPPIPVSPDSELIWRGGETKGASYETQLDTALIPYGKDDYAGSAKKLEQLEKKYPRKFEAKFYRGICLLLLNDAAGAVQELEAAKQLGKPQENTEAAWYLAIAQQRAGQNDLAFATLQTLCSTNSSYAARACEATKNTPSH